MITYEIAASERADIVDVYERFMRMTHIPDLLATGLFASATFSQSAPGRYQMRYEARDRPSLDRYLAEHASRLRPHFMEHFPGGVQLSREEWEVLESWPPLDGTDGE